MTEDEIHRRPTVTEQLEQFARPSDESDRKWNQNRTLDLRIQFPSSRRKSSHTGLERRLSRMLQKKDTLPEQHVKYFTQHETSKKSPDKPLSRRHNLSLNQDIGTVSQQLPMSSLERQHMLNTLSRGYQIFKQSLYQCRDMSSTEQKQRPRRLDPLDAISRTLVANVNRSQQQHSSPDKKLGRQELLQLHRQKQMEAGSVNLKLDKTIEKDGRVVPLRLLLSNKVRSKLVRDLISEDRQKVRQNIDKIITSKDEQHWVKEFSDIQNNLRQTQLSAKLRHHNQLVSRSNYTNAYYQYLALGKEEKQELRRRN